jgi:hypothetical protein
MENQITCPNCKTILTNSPVIDDAARSERAHIHYRIALCDGVKPSNLALFSNFRALFSSWTLCTRTNIYGMPRIVCWAKPASNAWSGSKAARSKYYLDKPHKSLQNCTRLLKTKKRKWPKEQLNKTANYFERNLPYMNYPTYLSSGYPIASGVIEGACRYFVKDRFELSGIRWLQTGAENLLRLRAAAENDDWDAYYAYRREQRQLRLYGQPASNMQPLEAQAINSQPVLQAFVSSGHSKRSQLPLAV